MLVFYPCDSDINLVEKTQIIDMCMKNQAHNVNISDRRRSRRHTVKEPEELMAIIAKSSAASQRIVQKASWLHT